jgi:hypothetical protein
MFALDAVEASEAGCQAWAVVERQVSHSGQWLLLEGCARLLLALTRCLKFGDLSNAPHFLQDFGV